MIIVGQSLSQCQRIWRHSRSCHDQWHSHFVIAQKCFRRSSTAVQPYFYKTTHWKTCCYCSCFYQCKLITNDGNGHLLMIGSKFHDIWRLHIVAIKSQSAATLSNTFLNRLLLRYFRSDTYVWAMWIFALSTKWVLNNMLQVYRSFPC